MQQKYGTGPVRPEQGLLKLRKELNTFGNLRPCNFASDSLTSISPLKEEVCRGVNFTIIRELTGGIYFGERKEEENDDGHAWDTEPYSRTEIERVTRLAAHLAMATEPPQKVWSLDKANVLATSRLWRKVVSEVMKKEFPQLQLGHHLIDSAAMLMVKDPRALNGIIVTSNLFGDIISDEASVIPGSLGLLPSASLNGVPDGKSVVSGIYEPIHGKCCTTDREVRWLLIVLDRLSSRYCGAGESQSPGNDPINGYDASILFQSTRRSKSNRGGGPANDRCQCAHGRHWREIDHQAGWRSCCSRAVETLVWIEAKARVAVHSEHITTFHQNAGC